MNHPLHPNPGPRPQLQHAAARGVHAGAARVPRQSADRGRRGQLHLPFQGPDSIEKCWLEFRLENAA